MNLTQRKIYELDVFGFTKFENVLSLDKVAYINKILDQELNGRNIGFFPFYELDEIFADILIDPDALQICSELLGPQFRVDHIYGIQREINSSLSHGENLHAGPMANQGSYQYTFHDHRPRPTMMLLMYCLEPVYAGDGGLVLIPGSHKQSMPLEGNDVYNLIDQDLHSWFVHQPCLNPGDMFLMMEAVVHGTRKWVPTDRRRRNLYYKFSPGFMAWRNYDDVAKYAASARNELERRLFRPPYVARYDETEVPRWDNKWRESVEKEMFEQHEFVVSRIIGNELPPRDQPGSRMKVLEYILENEKLPSNVKRTWVLNHIVDERYKAKIQKMLLERGETFIESPFSLRQYLTCLTREERIRYAININKARNEAFRHGSKFAKYVMVLDGDCFFNEEAWKQTVADIDREKAADAPQYFYLPITRVPMERAKTAEFDSANAGEPVIAFQSNADQLFDESIAFGNAEKVQLLARLGIKAMDGGQWDTTQSTKNCKRAGYVLHLQTGEGEVEFDVWNRGASRKESLDTFLSQLDEKARNSADPKYRLYMTSNSILQRLPPKVAQKLLKLGKDWLR